jgi:hypothetical protein
VLLGGDVSFDHGRPVRWRKKKRKRKKRKRKKKRKKLFLQIYVCFVF